MAKKQKRRFKKVIEAPINASCPFCKSKTSPNYKDYEVLAKFLTDRARIYNKDRSGVCAKHQRRLTLSVKQARHLALLPYVPQI